MARQFRLWENAAVVSLLPPAADAAGRTSAYVSLANGHKAFLVCFINQGNAATIALTPLQALDTVGTGSKVLTAPAPIAVNLNTATGDQYTIAAAAANYTTDAGTNDKIIIFEIDPIESMDLNSNTGVNLAGQKQAFNHLAIQTGASNAANITSALLIMTPLRFAQLNPLTVAV
jgi:hypothetical protein